MTLSDDDVYAANTLADPERVTPHANGSLSLTDGYLTIALPAVSWTVIEIGSDFHPVRVRHSRAAGGNFETNPSGGTRESGPTCTHHVAHSRPAVVRPDHL